MAHRHNSNSGNPTWNPGPDSQFFRSPREWEADTRARVYGHQLRRAWDREQGIGLWAVLCVEGKPAVYFKRTKLKDPEQENEWHRLLWNQGTATMLVVEDAQEVRVYSAFARPEEQPATTTEDDRLVEIFDRVAESLELASFIRSVETGQFYRDRPAKFRPHRAIDQYLLANLGEARDLLCDRELPYALAPATAHAFLGRCLFTCYLLERGVIGNAQLRRAGASTDAARAETLRDLLERLSSTEAIDILYGLFRILKDDFNGSMFGDFLAGEKQQIRRRHIDVIRRFFRGDDMKTQQSVLFPLYDFHFIPIEFISAIYEDFLATENVKTDEITPTSKSKRRKAGAYYTPPRLAELVVDIATESWDTLLDKRCLDPACGSGIFLVILFQRMAEEWRRKNPRATNTKRARNLRDLLTNNLYGIDVNQTACMVACFSLYLAFMDQFDDPRDIWGLAAELKKSGTEKVLPPLMLESEDGNDDPTRIPTIYAANFFGTELPELNSFDLIVGNPPWVGRNQPADLVLEQWILHRPTGELPGNPFIAELPESMLSEAALRSRFIPNRQTANAFMWKAPLHASATGTVCLLLPSKVLLANQIDEFQAAWFRRFRVDVIWQLADYSFILFAGADCPAVIIRYHSDKPEDIDEIAYITPKVTSLDPRDADIPVLSDDRKRVTLAEISDAANRKRAVTVWKKHFWGTGRDQELIERLMGLPALHVLAGEPDERKRFVKGQGFQPFDLDKYLANPKAYGEPKTRWWDDDMPFLHAKSKDWNWFLIEGAQGDCQPIGGQLTKLRRSPSKEVFRAPAVIVNQGCTKFAFTDFPVLFRDSLQAISASRNHEDENILWFLTAVLNSPLATYFLFHTSANWGVERDKVHFEELLRLPFPLPEDTRHEQRNRAILEQVSDLLRAAQAQAEDIPESALAKAHRKFAIANIKKEVFALVYEYYNLSSWERILIEETSTIFEPSSTPTLRRRNTPMQKVTKENDRRAYSETLCATLNYWLEKQPWSLSSTIQVAESSGLGLLTVTRTQGPREFFEASAGMEFEQVLTRIHRAVSQTLGGFSYARGFVLFESNQFHILKPLALRHWTKTAALNDADALMGFMVGREDRRHASARG